MSGRPENRESGIQGDRVILDRVFTRPSDGAASDADGYLTSGVLPVVKIYSPSGDLIVSSATPGASQPVRTAIGHYEYTYNIALTDVASEDWQIVWTVTIENQVQEHEELFIVGKAPLSHGLEEFRSGYAFNNPDTTSSHHFPSWGKIITPDELRYIVLFGIKLTSPEDNQVYDDNMLQYYVDQAIGVLEADFNFHIVPRIILHQDQKDSEGNRIDRFSLPAGHENAVRDDDKALIDQMTAIQKSRLVLREQGYPYRRNTATNNFMYMQLRQRPVQRVTKSKMVDPVQRTLIDLFPYLEEDLEMSGKVQFAFTQMSANLPLFLSGLSPFRYPFNDYPSALQIDYRSGYPHSSAIPHDLREGIRLYAGLLVMNDYGDVKLPGIASQSLNLNSISESFSTTQSAENSLYGARIKEYAKQFKEWYNKNRYRYGSMLLGAL